MTTSEDRLRVLKLIEEGKISPSEGIRMLDTVNPCAPESKTCSENANPQGPRWLRVLVTNIDTGKATVNVRLPVNLCNAGVKMGARLSTEVHGLDMQQINEYVRNGVTGQVVDILDDDDGERVEVFLE